MRARIDKKHERLKDIIGFSPLDEPLLSEIFENGRTRFHNLFGTKIMLPETNVLVGMKLKSANRRDKDNKRIKDIADVFSLLWFSDEGISGIKQTLFEYFPKDEAKETIDGFKKEEIAKVSTLVGITDAEIKVVFDQLT